MWTVIRYQTHHAAGLSPWTYQLLEHRGEADYQEQVVELKRNIDDRFDWSDKYRGVEVQPVPLADVSKDWLENMIRHLEARLVDTRERLEWCRGTLKGLAKQDG